ncbi:MAG TPA: hypothetical protein VM238_03555 [Phycisphaerae bacterium]|nr:hypothetical protein [Phycisphaerae bacterium]
MDSTLVELMKAAGPPDGPERESWESVLEFLDEDSGAIEVDTPDGPQRHVLKPLGQLFGNGHGVSSIDPADEVFMPLLLAIEESVLDCYREDPGLIDGRVSLALSRLAMRPDDPTDEVLYRHIQLRLRLLLSLNDYSRQEVRWALRKIDKSVRRHSRIDGLRGYLDFIRDQFGTV